MFVLKSDEQDPGLCNPKTQVHVTNKTFLNFRFDFIFKKRQKSFLKQMFLVSKESKNWEWLQKSVNRNINFL